MFQKLRAAVPLKRLVIHRRGLAREKLICLDENSLDEPLGSSDFFAEIVFFSLRMQLIYRREGNGVAIDGQESLFHCERFLCAVESIVSTRST